MLLRDYLKECVEESVISSCPEEALARARFHLARLYVEQDLQKDEAADLEREAIDVLKKYHSGPWNPDDIIILLDDLQPVFDGRFTGLSLLQNLQKWPNGRALAVGSGGQ